ncbi:MAG: peptidase associated/transthyretin-like domain-containing protein [Bacilli bacterium]
MKDMPSAHQLTAQRFSAVAGAFLFLTLWSVNAEAVTDPLCAAQAQLIQTLKAAVAQQPDNASLPAQATGANSSYDPGLIGKGYGKLRVKVIDGRTQKPIEGAEVVVMETEKRYRTDANGLTPWIQAPVIRNARFRFLVNELHGQLNLISYKNGYRDSVHMGVRLNEGAITKTTVWQYQIAGKDTRVEPLLYIEPYHRLWLIQLTDRFRRPSQIGEGYERP